MIEINRNPPVRQLRQFAALWFPAFGALVGFLLYRRLESPTAAFVVWAAAAVISIVGFFSPRFMRLVYVGMMTLTFPIGWVVSSILLLLVYYLVLTPVGVVMRIAGRDPMLRRLDRDATTYWIERSAHPPTARYFRQY